MRSKGQGQLADMVKGMSLTPGVGVDFGHLGRLLGLAALVYMFGAVLNWAQGYVMAGVAQRTVYRLREDVESKLARLPLKYFDQHLSLIHICDAPCVGRTRPVRGIGRGTERSQLR